MGFGGFAPGLLQTRWTGRSAVLLSGLLVVLPVFVEAPWVRQAPFSAVLFTAVLLAAGLGTGPHKSAGT
jgi:hypothetical protein